MSKPGSVGIVQVDNIVLENSTSFLSVPNINHQHADHERSSFHFDVSLLCFRFKIFLREIAMNLTRFLRP